MMKKLTGSDKQVAWAEDIRNCYVKQVGILRDAAERHANPTYEEREQVNPITKEVKVTRIARYNLGVEHHHAAAITRPWHPEYAEDGVVGTGQWPKFYSDIADTLENAINNEENAKYWIDRR